MTRTKKNPKKVAKKAKTTPDAQIGKLLGTTAKSVERIDDILTDLLMKAFPTREYVRYVSSSLGLNLEVECDAYAEYDFDFEVDESYYRIKRDPEEGTFKLKPYDGDGDSWRKITLTAKSIREAVEALEKEIGTEVPAEEFDPKIPTIETAENISNSDTDPAYPGWEIKKGDLGGFVKSEANLSHEGAAWVYEDAQVSEGKITEDIPGDPGETPEETIETRVSRLETRVDALAEEMKSTVAEIREIRRKLK